MTLQDAIWKQLAFSISCNEFLSVFLFHPTLKFTLGYTDIQGETIPLKPSKQWFLNFPIPATPIPKNICLGNPRLRNLRRRCIVVCAFEG